MSGSSPPNQRPQSRGNSNKSKSNKTCGFCDKTFSKSEHLSRHIRSHTKERPYTCGTCGKSYGRNDSLIRHRRTHNKIRGQPPTGQNGINNQSPPLLNPLNTTFTSMLHETHQDTSPNGQIPLPNQSTIHGNPTTSSEYPSLFSTTGASLIDPSLTTATDTSSNQNQNNITTNNTHPDSSPTPYPLTYSPHPFIDPQLQYPPSTTSPTLSPQFPYPTQQATTTPTTSSNDHFPVWYQAAEEFHLQSVHPRIRSPMPLLEVEFRAGTPGNGEELEGVRGWGRCEREES